jgi:hypothetical protein
MSSENPAQKDRTFSIGVCFTGNQTISDDLRHSRNNNMSKLFLADDIFYCPIKVMPVEFYYPDTFGRQFE